MIARMIERFPATELARAIAHSPAVALLGPKGLAPDVLRLLNAEVLKALTTKELRETFANQGLEATGSTPQQFSAFIGEEIIKWSRAIKASGARVD